MAVTITRSGRRRNRSSNSDSKTIGHSTMYTTSSSFPSGSCQSPSAASSSTMRRRRVGCVGLDVRRPQRVGVLLRGRDLELTVSEAVAEGLAGARQRLPVELLAVPPHRPREAMAARVPAHRLRELEPVDDRAHPLEQRLSAQRLPRHAGPQVAVPLLEVRLGEPVALREAGGGLLPPLRGRPLHELLRGGLRQLVDDERDPARAYIDMRCVHSQVATDELGKLTFGLPARRGRQLLAAELKQQRRHRAARRRGAPPSA